MQTLVIDTSYGSTVGVVGHEPIVETDSRTHVEKLQVNIAHAVEQAGLRPTDIERIVVGAVHGTPSGHRSSQGAGIRHRSRTGGTGCAFTANATGR